MKKLRCLSDAGFSARENVALTAALVELRGEDSIPDTLRIYRYPRSVLLGRNQIAQEEADLAACEAGGVEIARRITGGGAIFMDAGVLTWDLVMARPPRTTLADFSRLVGAALAEAIAKLGTNARFKPENDIMIGDRKVAGSSGFSDGETLVYQGSLMIAPDFAAMSKALRLGDVSTRLTSLQSEIGRDIEVSLVEATIVNALANALVSEPEGAFLTLRERERMHELHREELGLDGFVFGTVRVAA